MIIRLWHGRTLKADYQAYTNFMIDRAVPDYKSVKGNIACYFTRRLEGETGHFLLITHWESLAGITAFAGTDPTVAKYYPEDDKFLLEKETYCHLYEVFYDSVTRSV